MSDNEQDPKVSEQEVSEQEYDDEDEDQEESQNGGNIPIDLSENEIYRGVCTLLEDEEGNNILEYISLLHTELIGINKSLENLKSVKNDIRRIADCAELFVKGNSEKGVPSSVTDPSRKVVKKKQ